MSVVQRSRSRLLAALAALAVGGLGLAVAPGPASAATAAPAAPAAPAVQGLPRSACSEPVADGKVRCLALFRSAAEAAARGTAAPTAAVASPDGRVPRPTEGYGPADIASIYGLGRERGSSLVAVVDAFDNPNAEADLAAFRSAYGLPPCTTRNGCLRRINQRGGTTMPEGDPGWGVEIDLDLQAVSAACPRCRILFVGADTNSLDDIGIAVDQAVAQGAKIVSNSYGGSEFNGILDVRAAHYVHPGVAQVASSGDFGFPDALFPASAGNVIAAGGTTVTRTATGWAHSAWSGAGSGCSAWFTKPFWQRDRNCLMRTTSDVSALADPDTGFAVYDTYGLELFGLTPGWLVVGGTSLSAPLIAGMIGLAGNASELSTAAYVYRHPRGLLDVVGGSNGYCGGDYLCTGLPGYDGPTGVGTPRGLSAL